MEKKKVLTRGNIPTEELQKEVIREFKGYTLKYNKVYYLDYQVDENTGMIDKNQKTEYCTKNQMNRNLRAFKNAYLVARGAADPNEIKSFRKKYKLAASTLSIILGFSKNTISNIENDGVTSLATGRLIKMCINNLKLLKDYIYLCDELDQNKKDELNKLLV